MYDGTLRENWEALVTFQQMIVLCNPDGHLDMTPSAIAGRTGIPIEHIKRGIELLESPDPYSRTPAEEGRRILRIDEHKPWGWKIVNHEQYKSLQDAETVRHQIKERVRKHREKKRTVTDGNAQKRHTYSDTNTEKASTEFESDSITNPVKKKSKRSTAKVQATEAEFIESLKSMPAYQGVDVDRELLKMDAWFLSPKGHGRKKTKGFIINWLNKAEVSYPVNNAPPANAWGDVPDLDKEYRERNGL